MGRPTRPPAMDYFDERRPTAGAKRITLCLGPLEIEVDGLGDTLEELLFRRYSPYASRDAGGSSALQVRVGLADEDYFIDPPTTPEFVRVHLAPEGNRVRYVSYQVAGWFDTLGGRGDLLLGRGDFEPRERSFENYVRAAVAWQAASRGGALVHAASAVWKGKAYLFYGESGAGKSTLSECNRRARVVSDDLSLVLPGPDGGLEVIGSPFRGTYEGGSPVQGRFPLVAGFRLIKAPSAEVRSVARVQAFGELVANLPFVAEAFDDRPDLFDRAYRAFEKLPMAHLLFRRDDSYWDAIEAAGY